MGVFAHFYYTSFLKEVMTLDVGELLNIASGLSAHEQLDLFTKMGQYLYAQGVLDDIPAIAVRQP